MEANRIFSNKKVVVVLAILACFLWGSALPMIKIVYVTYGINLNDFAAQILFAGIRFTFSGLLIILVASLSYRKLPKVEFVKIPQIIHLSLFQTLCQSIFFYMGLAKATGTNASIIDGSCALVTVILAGFFIKKIK